MFGKYNEVGFEMEIFKAKKFLSKEKFYRKETHMQMRRYHISRQNIFCCSNNSNLVCINAFTR